MNGGIDFTEMSFEVEVSQTIGIEEHEAIIDVYPNPADDLLYITNGSMIESITLSNLLGEVILKTNSNADRSI